VVEIVGTDDMGARGGPVSVEIPPGLSLTFTAAELESGNASGLTGALGDGAGKWWLKVMADQPLAVMSLLSSPTGHLTNLSSVPANEENGRHAVALFPSASDVHGRQGFVRVVNHGSAAGTVSIRAFDDVGQSYPEVRLSIGPNETKHFNSNDLEDGNSGKGLSGSTGGGRGDWRLELTSALDLDVLAYIRTPDGFVTAMHDVAPVAATEYRVAVFNPGSNTSQQSMLRLVNQNAASTKVTITGNDDAGASPGSQVRLTVPAGASRMVSAQELESGASTFEGALGDGSGKWSLAVQADQPISVVSLLSSPTGHLTNLSTVPEGVAQRAFRTLISPIVQAKCVACHVPGGEAGGTRLVFARDTEAGHPVTNLRAFEEFVDTVLNGADVVLRKIRDPNHAGGVQVAPGTDEYTEMERFLTGLGGGPAPVFGQPQSITTVADGASSTFAADLDGDGDPDVLSASTDDDTIAWYENLGGGAFSGARAITTTAAGASAVHAVDVDGDGDPDVLSASANDDTIAWYENLGGGAFSGPRDITTAAAGAASVHAADLDGDGDADILSASADDGKIAWYENQRDGASFREHVITGGAAGARSVHAVDLDGDGDADVLSASARDGKIAWHENMGGAFAGERIITTGAAGARSVHAVDVEGDGDADILSASADDGRIAWYENGGGGLFSRARDITTSAAGASSVHAADVDGDGDTDVLSASFDDGKIAWHENLGSGAFSGERVITTSAVGASAVHAADLDGDGDADVLSAAAVSDELAWYENLSDHGDDHGHTPAEASLVTALPAFLHGVLESPGDRDVFRIATGGATLRVRSNGPVDTYGTLLDAQGRLLAGDDNAGRAGNFLIEAEVVAGTHYVEVRGGIANATGPYTVSIETVGLSFASPRVIGPELAPSVYAVDLDGDGDPDVLSATLDPDGITWYENLGRGAFSPGRVITSALRLPVSVHAADLDGDGDADVLSASANDDKIAWYENQGGRFSEQRIITMTAREASSVHAADLDGDGHPDVVSASASVSAGEIAWYYNEGGRFAPARVIANQDEASTVHAADLDGDGDADLLSGSGEGIAWYENDGAAGTLSGWRRESITTAFASSLLAADLNGDGYPDVLSALPADGKIAWYENLGGGVFAREQVIAMDADSSLSVHAADLDGDGDADVLAAGEARLAWYENLGGRAFSAQRVIADDVEWVRSVHAADLDGDGDPDVLAPSVPRSSGSQTGDEFAWHENLSDHGDDYLHTVGGARLATALPAFLHGVLESAGDRDLFQFATGDGILRVRSLGPTDTYGTLLDSSFSQLAVDDDAGVPPANFMLETDVAAGLHYLEVRGYGSATGAYALAVEFVSASQVAFGRQEEALRALYESTDGPNWTDSTNWLTGAPLGDWYGVETDDAGWVTELVLDGNNLTGTIPGEIGSLEGLEVLALGNSNLTGSIPPELGKLARLEKLAIAGTSLTGAIPRELGGLTNLESLILFHNGLTGAIPRELGNLASLEELALSHNALSGRVPGELGYLADLEGLLLNDNPGLSGPLPATFTGLNRLQALDALNTRLCLPTDAAFVAWWERINAEAAIAACVARVNVVSGAGQSGAAGTELPLPVVVQATGANGRPVRDALITFTPAEGDGSVSPELVATDADGAAGTVWTLGPKVGEQMLIAVTEPEISLSVTATATVTGDELVVATELVSGDGQRGEAGEPLSERVVVEAVDQNGSPVAGATVVFTPGIDHGAVAPAEVVTDTRGRAATTWTLGLGDIEQSMTVAVGTLFMDVRATATYSQRTALEALYHVTGGPGWTNRQNWLKDVPLDQWHGVSVDDAGQVARLRLEDNGLVGRIPPAVGELSGLWSLNLSSNRITGPIPPEIGNLDGLVDLLLSNNQLVGEIPRELLHLSSSLDTLDLANNRLTGALPFLGAFDKLAWVTLGGNLLEGGLHHVDWRNLRQLLLLDLSRNRLSGSLPRDLGELGSLALLNLSENKLSGRVPAEFSRLADLLVLQLERNPDLSGPLPETFPDSLDQLEELHFFGTSLCAPRERQFVRWVASLRSSTGRVCRQGETWAHLTQTIQEMYGGIPVLPAERDIDRVYPTPQIQPPP
ncbi:MAG: hypothetical protein F4X36_06110, partial [Gammaproteobacteria bacterium]|nr:hypothetical protein [Gammaproteobacteria bacterium]